MRYNAFRATGFRQTGVGGGNCDFSEAASFSEKRFNMDPSDVTGNNNAGQFYLSANQPKNALRVLMSYDTRLRNMDTRASARESWISMAHFSLKEYAEAIEVIESYPFEWIQPILSEIHLRSLVELKRYNDIESTLEYYDNRKIWARGGGEREMDFLLTVVCNHLLVVGQDSLAKIYAVELMNWTEQNKEDGHYWNNVGNSLFFQGLFKEAATGWENIEPDSRGLNILSDLGICYAKLDNINKAREHIEMIDVSERPLGRRSYNQARILAAMGEEAEAIKMIVKAKENCISHFIGNFQTDHAFRPLFGNSEFQELVRPER